jgi:hypothetical protein
MMPETKHNEKEEEKRGEKQDEKKGGWDEKWQRDRVSAISWASILIWGAAVLLIGTSSTAGPMWTDHGWSVFLVGAGIIILLTALYRWLMPAHRRPLIGSFVIGTIMLGVGLGDVVAWSENIIWVVVLLVIAVGILLSAFRRH